MNLLSGAHVLSAHTYSTSYTRINKVANVKTLRCFPSCLETGHRAYGWCGNTVSLDISSCRALTSLNPIFVGYFCPKDDPVPSRLSAADYIHSELTEGAPAPMYNHHINFVAYGWHYSWTSNRSKTSTRHVFRIVALDPQEKSLVLGYCDTPTFNVVSSRSSDYSNNKVGVYSDCMLVLRALHARVQNIDENDFGLAFEDDADMRTTSDDMSMEDAMCESLTLSATTETRLLELEKLDAMLERILKVLPQWIRECELGPNQTMQIYLSQRLDVHLKNEPNGHSLTDVAKIVRRLLPELLDKPPPSLLPLPNDDNKSKWLHTAHTLMSEYVTLCPDGIVVGSVNDIAGTWSRSSTDIEIIDHARTMLGYSFVERELWELADTQGVKYEIIDAKTIRVTYGSIVQMAVLDTIVNLPQVRSDLFPNGISRMACASAHTTGLALCFFHDHKTCKLVILSMQRPRYQEARVVLHELNEDTEAWTLRLNVCYQRHRVV